jgi:hypothetical protein
VSHYLSLDRHRVQAKLTVGSRSRHSSLNVGHHVDVLEIDLVDDGNGYHNAETHKHDIVLREQAPETDDSDDRSDDESNRAKTDAHPEDTLVQS